MHLGNGLKLILMAVIGILCVEVALSGDLGSILGALITPDQMQQGANPYNAAAAATWQPVTLPPGVTPK